MHTAIAQSLVGLAAVLAMSSAEGLELADGCPDHSYLGNRPSDRDEPDWSEQAQGIANDGESWFFTRDTRLFKYDANWRDVDGDDVGKLLGGGVGFPPELAEGTFSDGIDHFGDPDYYGGHVFIPFENNHPACPVVCSHDAPFAIIGVYTADNLTFVDWIDITDYQEKAGWVAIDPVKQQLYTSLSTLDGDTPVLRYDLDVSKLENGIQGDFLTIKQLENGDIAPEAKAFLLEGSEESPRPVAGKFSYMQGGVFTPWGDLYLAVGKAGASPSDVRGGLHLFRPTQDGNLRLVESSENVDSETLPDPRFAYRYDPIIVPEPDSVNALGEEPEGVDWWNRDNDPDSRYPGQLHAILLDNEALADDEIWLKHYRVDYFCVDEGVDTDGDGVSDRDEVYRDNTHPKLGDSDHDGIDDTLDNCRLRHNADQADLDGDGLGDRCDADKDGDGQSNSDEAACGSDPLDGASLAPDLDGDQEPDCVDEDDDADGQSDADEAACGSDPLDATSLAPDFDGDDVPDCVDSDDDGDGVDDTADRCPGTLLPDSGIPASGALGRNRYALIDEDLVFDRNTVGQRDVRPYTTADTGGCNASQIADALRLGKDHYESGITKGVLDAWIASAP
jgi:hypothetical protein